MNEGPLEKSPPRLIVGAMVGVLGAIVIWLITPYSNFVVRNSNIVDSYIPAIVVFFTLVLVLAVNPLLRWVGAAGLSRRQLAVALGVMLVACTLPNQGLLRSFIFGLARASGELQQDKGLSDEYGRMNLPPSLFPEKLQGKDDLKAGTRYVDGLQPHDSIPWQAWGGPLFTSEFWRHPRLSWDIIANPLFAWGTFLAFCWMMMVGLGMITFPQWRNNERLAFPLLAVQQALIEVPEGGGRPPLMRARSFWVAAIAVFLVYLMYGANIYLPDRVPKVPLRWDFTALFAEPPWNTMPGYIRFGRLYLLFMGVAFFMPTRISFSIWFFLIVYGIYRGFAPHFGWTSYIEKTDDQRYGAVIMLAICVLYIGRAHWAAVFRAMFSRASSPEQHRNRRSGWIFFVGIAGMFAWLLWAGVQPGWALVLVGFAFIASLLISRIVAETGMSFIRLWDRPITMMQIVPIAWVSATSLFFAGIIDILFTLGSRVSVTAMATHAIALDDDASPRQQARTGVSMIGVLMIGLVIAGGANLFTNYRNSVTLDGQPMHNARQTDLREVDKAIKELSSIQLSNQSYNRYAYFGGGAALAAGLYWLCMAVPKWPIHPFGLMLVDTYAGHEAFASIFFGWLLQVVIVRFGGARFYRLARPVFLGLIIGEVTAAIFWAIVPFVMLAFDKTYIPVHILP
ncbi:MAG: hypothetical protein PHU85_07130 [Phycisphaerae bacterium]|nr:hypothetical protein [Phycisphaerae bacterium]